MQMETKDLLKSELERRNHQNLVNINKNTDAFFEGLKVRYFKDTQNSPQSDQYEKLHIYKNLESHPRAEFRNFRESVENENPILTQESLSKETLGKFIEN